LLGFGELSDDTLMRIFRNICVVDVEPDAMTYLPYSLDVQAIREEDAYGGRRVTLQAHLGPARPRIQIDIGIGDAVTPEPQWIEYPSLLDLPRPHLRAYPRETVIAEKLHAMVLIGMRNSRMKDYFDVHALLCEGKLDMDLLAQAIASTFERRRTDVPARLPIGLSDAFPADAEHRTQWQAFLTKNRLRGPHLQEIVSEIRERLAPVLERAHRIAKA
jgi:hypothetical protein